jgi:hypothetical protein
LWRRNPLWSKRWSHTCQCRRAPSHLGLGSNNGGFCWEPILGSSFPQGRNFL